MCDKSSFKESILINSGLKQQKIQISKESEILSIKQKHYMIPRYSKANDTRGKEKWIILSNLFIKWTSMFREGYEHVNSTIKVPCWEQNVIDFSMNIFKHKISITLEKWKNNQISFQNINSCFAMASSYSYIQNWHPMNFKRENCVQIIEF